MEASERELILALAQQNFELNRLYSEHEEFERKLDKFKARSFLTPSEQMDVQRLKKAKLFGVDQMMQIVSMHRAA